MIRRGIRVIMLGRVPFWKFREVLGGGLALEVRVEEFMWCVRFFSGVGLSLWPSSS